MKLSIKIPRAIRHLDAPRAMRMANSRLCLSVRASRIVVTFSSYQHQYASSDSKNRQRELMSFFLPAAINELDIGPGFFPIVGDRSFPTLRHPIIWDFSPIQVARQLFSFARAPEIQKRLASSAKHSERRGGHIRHHGAKHWGMADSRQRNPNVGGGFRINPGDVGGATPMIV